jgi:hypothetical protein
MMKVVAVSVMTGALADFSAAGQTCAITPTPYPIDGICCRVVG